MGKAIEGGARISAIRIMNERPNPIGVHCTSDDPCIQVYFIDDNDDNDDNDDDDDDDDDDITIGVKTTNGMKKEGMGIESGIKHEENDDNDNANNNDNDGGDKRKKKKKKGEPSGEKGDGNENENGNDHNHDHQGETNDNGNDEHDDDNTTLLHRRTGFAQGDWRSRPNSLSPKTDDLILVRIIVMMIMMIMIMMIMMMTIFHF